MPKYEVEVKHIATLDADNETDAKNRVVDLLVDLIKNIKLNHLFDIQVWKVLE